VPSPAPRGAGDGAREQAGGDQDQGQDDEAREVAAGERQRALGGGDGTRRDRDGHSAARARRRSLGEALGELVALRPDRLGPAAGAARRGRRGSAPRAGRARRGLLGVLVGRGLPVNPLEERSAQIRDVRIAGINWA